MDISETKTVQFNNENSSHKIYLSAEKDEHTEAVHLSFLRELVRVCLEKRWIILIVSALVLLFTVVKLILATPYYQANALLRIDTYSPVMRGISTEDALVQQTREYDYLNTQIEIISSLGVAQIALKDEALRAELEEYFKFGQTAINTKAPIEDSTYNEPVSLLTQYSSLIKVVPVRTTSLVKLIAETSSAELSAKIANAHSRAFINFVRSELQNQSLGNLEFLQTQASELAQRVAHAERKLSAYAEKNSIVSINKDENIVLRRMSELSTKLSEITAKRIEAENTWKNADKSALDLDNDGKDLALRDLRSEIYRSEAKYRELLQKFTPAYPKMKQLNKKIQSLKQRLRSRVNARKQRLKIAYQSLVDTENQLTKELDSQRAKAFDLSRRQVEYNNLNREFESLKELHLSVLKQVKETQLSAKTKSSNVSLIEPAIIPTRASSPRTLSSVLLACFFGPFIGGILAFVLDHLDQSVRSPAEISKYLRLPVLSVVPDFTALPALTASYLSDASAREEPKAIQNRKGKGKGKSPRQQKGKNKGKKAPKPTDLKSKNTSLYSKEAGLANDESALLLLSSPNSVASEVFRSLRAALLLSAANRPPHSILITSAKSGEGKSVLAANLATTFAVSGSRVLLLGADLRRPSLHNYFPIKKSSPGLSEYLSGLIEHEEILHKTEIQNFSIIGAGAIPPNPAELIGSRRMSELLDSLQGEFDHIIIDSPPIFPVTDALLLSRLVDGVVVVARANSTPKPMVKEITDRLRSANANILGLILNGADLQNSDYYYYRQAYQYHYSDSLHPLSRAAKIKKFGSQVNRHLRRA